MATDARKPLFPEGIAVLGVSPSPAKLANVVVPNLTYLDFGGHVVGARQPFFPATNTYPSNTKCPSRCLMNISIFLIDRPELVTLDLNPRIVLKEDQGCFAVDAGIERA
jgi:hypothetical protein